jgi:hypothetical protein
MQGFAFNDDAGEPARRWARSSRSWGNGNCVEVAGLGSRAVGVRDSKNPQGHVLQFSPTEWNAFLGGVRNGKFDGQ